MTGLLTAALTVPWAACTTGWAAVTTVLRLTGQFHPTVHHPSAPEQRSRPA